MKSYKDNPEQNQAHAFYNQQRLEEKLKTLPESTQKLYRHIERNGQKEAANNKIYSLFFLRQEGQEVGFMCASLTQDPDLIRMENKLEARKNFALFTPQILQTLHGLGFEAAIRDKATGQTLSNFNPDSDDGEDDFWKKPANK